MAISAPFLLLCLALFASTSYAWDGPIKTRNEQCLDDGFEGACDFIKVDGSLEYGCGQLRCARKIGEGPDGPHYIPRYSNAKPAKGTYCGPSSYCDERVCKTYPRSALPEYTGPETEVPNCNYNQMEAILQL